MTVLSAPHLEGAVRLVGQCTMKRVVGGSANGQVEGHPIIRPDVDRRAGVDRFWFDTIHPDF